MSEDSLVWARVPVTVVAGHRRADLALPGAVPVAELLPSLVGYAALLDPALDRADHRLATDDGRVLSPDRGLAAQGVTPGALLVLETAAEPARYDDVVEAVAQARRDPMAGWLDEASRRLPLLTVAAVLMLGTIGLAADHRSAAAPVAAAVVSMALLVSTWVLSRVTHTQGLALLAALSACAYAATSGLVLAWRSPLLGVPGAVAGGACAATGALAAVGIGEGRDVMVVPVFVGVVFLVAGFAPPVLDPAAALMAATVLAVAASPAFPTIAVMVTRTGRLGPAPDHDDPGTGADLVRVEDDVRLAHRLVGVWTAAVGVLVLLVAPLATSSGLIMASPAALAALVLATGPSDRRGALASFVGALSGTLGLVVMAASALWLHPSWRPVVAPALAAVGLLLLARACGRTAAPSAWRTRTCELTEAAALVGLAPALVLAVCTSVGVHLRP